MDAEEAVVSSIEAWVDAGRAKVSAALAPLRDRVLHSSPETAALVQQLLGVVERMGHQIVRHVADSMSASPEASQTSGPSDSPAKPSSAK